MKVLLIVTVFCFVVANAAVVKQTKDIETVPKDANTKEDTINDVPTPAKEMTPKDEIAAKKVETTEDKSVILNDPEDDGKDDTSKNDSSEVDDFENESTENSYRAFEDDSFEDHSSEYDDSEDEDFEDDDSEDENTEDDSFEDFSRRKLRRYGYKLHDTENVDTLKDGPVEKENDATKIPAIGKYKQLVTISFGGDKPAEFKEVFADGEKKKE